MSGAGRGPTLPAPDIKPLPVVIVTADQQVRGHRKGFRGQPEPTGTIIGSGSGDRPVVWAQRHGCHRAEVNVAGAAPAATAVNSSRSHRSPAGKHR